MEGSYMPLTLGHQIGHQMALSLLTLMLGGALTTKPRATKRDATTMIRSLGFGLERDAEPRPVDSATVKLIKREPEFEHSILKNRFSQQVFWCVGRN